MMRPLALFLLLCILPACQRPPMVLPTMFAAGQVDPLADTPDAWRTNEHRLFFATDREFDPERGDLGRYNHKRSDALHLGHLQIGLGSDNAWQQLDAATQARPGGRRPRPTILGIDTHGDMRWDPAGLLPNPVQPNTNQYPQRIFIEHLNETLAQSGAKEITIYIHGFKNSFEEAALTAAELSLYSGGLGPFILYSWPSYDSLFEYSHDRDSVRYTTAHARRFVEFLADEILADRLHAKRINLIAHSTGAEVAGSVLRELALMSYALTPEERQARWSIGDVLLIAPDISKDVARERLLKEDLRGMYDQIVVYASKRDTALRWASYVLYRVARIGSISEKQLSEADRYWLNRSECVTLIDIDSQPNGDPVLHSHHRYSGATLSDILLCLRSNLKPEQRGLTRGPGQIIWRFADDYPTRVTEAAIQVYGKAPKP